MTRRALLWAAACAIALPAWPDAPVRERRNFDADWRFHKGEVTGGDKADLDDRA